MTTRVVAVGDQQQQSVGKGLGRRRLYFCDKGGMVMYSCWHDAGHDAKGPANES